MARQLCREDLHDIKEAAKYIIDCSDPDEIQDAIDTIQEILNQNPVSVITLIERDPLPPQHDLGGEG